ncbi:MAG: TadE/TadG family type IV pilus assembly protein [Mycobacteriales bacterium]
MLRLLSSRRDRGSAPVDFVLVGLLVTLLFCGLLQLGFDLHIRNVLAACAADGARVGADANETPALGAAYANQLITQAVGARYARAVAMPDAQVDGAAVVTILVRARLPLLVDFLPAATVTVRGRALAEP